jgi:hypothetical protein
LYGAEDQIDSKRLVDLADGFSTYTTTSKTVNQLDMQTSDSLVLAPNGDSLINARRPKTITERKNKLAATEATLTLAKDSADILLSREGSLVQTLLLEESVRATSAQVKDDVRDLLVDGPKRFRESVPFGALLPPLPFEDQLSPFVGKTEEETRAQQLAKKLISLVSQQQLDRIRAPGSSSNEPVNGSSSSPPPAALRALIRDVEPEQLAVLSRELRMSAPKYLPLVGVLGAKFTSSLLEAASDNIDAALERGGAADELTKVTARSLSRIARRGADTISEGIVGNNLPQD